MAPVIASGLNTGEPVPLQPQPAAPTADRSSADELADALNAIESPRQQPQPQPQQPVPLASPSPDEEILALSNAAERVRKLSANTLELQRELAAIEALESAEDDVHAAYSAAPPAAVTVTPQKLVAAPAPSSTPTPNQVNAAKPTQSQSPSSAAPKPAATTNPALASTGPTGTTAARGACNML